MSTDTLIPLETGGVGSNALSAGIGAFVGSWFGNGWGGWGNNRFGNSGVGETVVAQNAIDNSMVIDGLSNISNQLNTVNTTLLNSQANQNMALCQGFSGINTALYQTNANTARDMGTGFNAVADAVTRTASEQRMENLGNFNNLNTALANASAQTQLGMAQGFGNAAYENARCCCEIKNAVHGDGEQTRALIEQNYVNQLQTQLCDAKSKIGSLESQQYTSALIAGQSAIFDTKLQNAVQTILDNIKVSGT